MAPSHIKPSNGKGNRKYGSTLRSVVGSVVGMMIAFSVGMLVSKSSHPIAMNNDAPVATLKKAQPDVNIQQEKGGYESHRGDLEAETIEHFKSWENPFIPNHVQVYEDFLPPRSRHQEGGVCTIGSKVYIVGGSNSTVADYLRDVEELGERQAIHNVMAASLGTTHVSIYDMEDMTTTYAPDYPYPANHITCAKSPDGVTLHLTGGYIQNSVDKQFAAHTEHYALDTTKEDNGWVRMADMPHPRGGHGCDFMADGRMYCVGGGSYQDGPYSTSMIIYDPDTDTWEEGPSMEYSRDHVMDSVTAIKGGTQLYVPGGRTHSRDDIDVYEATARTFGNSNVVEVYDLETKQWSRKTDLLLARAAIHVVPYHRYGPDEEPNLLLVGGELFLGYSGKVERQVDEYDPINDLYYCLDQIPHPTFGGGLGVHDGKLHIITGGEWLGLTATRRVQLYDLKKSLPPRECFYEVTPVYDQWDRLWNKARPYPGFRENKRVSTGRP